MGKRKAILFVAVLMLLLTGTPLYARGGYSPPEVTIPLFLITISIIIFAVIGTIAQESHFKETGKKPVSLFPIIISSVIASVVITFGVVYVLNATMGFMLVGFGALLGFVLLFVVYYFVVRFVLKNF